MPRHAPHIRQSVCIKVLAHVIQRASQCSTSTRVPIGASVFPPVHCCLDTYRVGCGEASWGPPHIPVGGATSLLHSYNMYATRGVVELHAGAETLPCVSGWLYWLSIQLVRCRCPLPAALPPHGGGMAT